MHTGSQEEGKATDGGHVVDGRDALVSELNAKLDALAS